MGKAQYVRAGLKTLMGFSINRASWKIFELTSIDQTNEGEKSGTLAVGAGNSRSDEHALS